MDTSKQQEPPSAFVLYKEDIIQGVIKDNPDLSKIQITKLIAQKWVQLDETTCKKYEQQHQEYKDKIERGEKISFEKNNGHYEAPKKVTAMDVVNMLKPSAKTLAPAQKPATLAVKLPKVQIKAKYPSKPQAVRKTVPKKEEEQKKKEISAFSLYKDEVIQTVKRDNPDLFQNEITKLIAQNWVLSGEDVHKAYEKKLAELQTSNEDYKEKEEKNIYKISEPEYQYQYDFYYEEKKKSAPKKPSQEYYDSSDDEERYNDYPDSEDEEYNEEESYEEGEEVYGSEVYEKKAKPKSYFSQSQPVAVAKKPLEAKKKVKEAEVVEPEEPLTAFVLFKNENLEETQKENPDCNMSEILRITAQKWTLSDEKVKEKYEQMSQNQ